MKREKQKALNLQESFPAIAAEWHPTKNGELNPQDVTFGSNKSVWWICEHGHEWETAVVNRTYRNNGCPYCTRKRPIVGETDLGTLMPEVAKEWHPSKNGELLPSDFLPMSNKKIWWLCQHGHEWEAPIASRTNMKSGCPICSGRKVLAGYNDLASAYPNIAAEWHPTKNEELTPQDVTHRSNKKVWWVCPHGHEWKTEIRVRTLGSGCPVCAGKGRYGKKND